MVDDVRRRMMPVPLEKTYRFFYPSVPAVLCSSHRGTVSAMPVVSFTSLSTSPPTVGISSSPNHSTHRTILASKCFALCWLDKSDAGAVGYLASHAGKKSQDKLLLAGLKHHNGKRLEVPVIDSSVAVLECSLKKTLDFGDHDLLVGRIEAAYANDDFEEYWKFKKYRPILYTGWKGRLTTLGQTRRSTSSISRL